MLSLCSLSLFFISLPPPNFTMLIKIQYEAFWFSFSSSSVFLFWAWILKILKWGNNLIKKSFVVLLTSLFLKKIIEVVKKRKEIVTVYIIYLLDIFSVFLYFLTHADTLGHFSKKSTFLTCFYSMNLLLEQKNQKNWWPISDILHCERTKEIMEEQS